MLRPFVTRPVSDDRGLGWTRRRVVGAGGGAALCGGLTACAPSGAPAGGQPAQNTPPSYCGMLKYEEYNEVDEKTKDAWTRVEANQMSAKDCADLAQKAIEDAKLGSKGIG
jgi:hypothetical protein